jgi:hypothetical protein
MPYSTSGLPSDFAPPPCHHRRRLDDGSLAFVEHVIGGCIDDPRVAIPVDDGCRDDDGFLTFAALASLGIGAYLVGRGA